MSHNSPYELARTHRKFMIQAIQLAEEAYDGDEVPIGALVVHNKNIVGKGYNQVEMLNDATAHAEMLAISAACSTLQSKYLDGCTLYVTLEPCPMCATAAVWSKIDRIVFGASDADYGACGSVFNLSHHRALNHDIEIIQGVMEKECEEMVRAFFKEKRDDEDRESDDR